MYRITHFIVALAVNAVLATAALPGSASAGMIEGDEDLGLLDGQAPDRTVGVWDDVDMLVYPVDGESKDDLASSVWFDIDRLAASTTVIDADTVAVGRIRLERNVTFGPWYGDSDDRPTEELDVGSVDLVDLLSIAVGVHDGGLNDSQLMALEDRLVEMAQGSIGHMDDGGDGTDAFFDVFFDVYADVGADRAFFDVFFDVFFDAYAEAGGTEDLFDVCPEIADHPPADHLDGALDGGHSIDGAPALTGADALIAALLLPPEMSRIAVFLLLEIGI